MRILLKINPRNTYPFLLPVKEGGIAGTGGIVDVKGSRSYKARNPLKTYEYDPRTIPGYDNDETKNRCSEMFPVVIQVVNGMIK